MTEKTETGPPVILLLEKYKPLLKATPCGSYPYQGEWAKYGKACSFLEVAVCVCTSIWLLKPELSDDPLCR